MQANNIIHKNNYNISISFKAGLTPKIMKDIQAVNPTEISQYLSNKEIVTNFQDNKIIAWCCAKVVEIIEYINNQGTYASRALYTRVLKTYLMLGATKNIIYSYPNDTQGYGVLDLQRTIEAIANKL